MTEHKAVKHHIEKTEAPAASKKRKPKESGSKKSKKLSTGQKSAVAAILVLLLIVGAYFLHDNYKYESTDDAYVHAYSTQLAPQVSALVTQVYVQENQKVRAGQILAQLDRKDYETALADANASLGALQAQSANAEKDLYRSQSLLHSRVISQQQFDAARSNFLNLERQAKAAEAKMEQTKLDLEYTSLRAPSDGEIALRSVDPGMFVSAGTAVFGFVPNDTRWIDANFKETQLEFVAPGRPVEITVDSIPGKKFAGVVESLSPATGSTFTLMPPDNATGNFTKVVQRLPVRIRIKNIGPQDMDKLQAGLSANVNLLKHVPLEALPPGPQPVFMSEETKLPEKAEAQR